MAGKWSVEMGTYGDDGQIMFNYFTGKGYWSLVEHVGSGNNKGSVSRYNKKYKKKVTSSEVELQVGIKSSTNIADDEWHHVAITRYGTEFKIALAIEQTL